MVSELIWSTDARKCTLHPGRNYSAPSTNLTVRWQQSEWFLVEHDEPECVGLVQHETAGKIRVYRTVPLQTLFVAVDWMREQAGTGDVAIKAIILARSKKMFGDDYHLKL